jgi:hypothetical protein
LSPAIVSAIALRPSSPGYIVHALVERDGRVLIDRSRLLRPDGSHEDGERGKGHDRRAAHVSGA